MNDPCGLIAGELLDRRSLVAITGGGGKTTLMFSLAEKLSRRARVVVSTTTKICAPDAGALLGPYEKTRLEDALARENPVVAGRAVESGKLTGWAPEEADRLFADAVADHCIIEADGAKHMPFKAYGEHEPLIPAGATLQIVVVGAEIFSRAASDEIIFRFELAKERWGVSGGERVGLETIAAMLESKKEYMKNSPSCAIRLLFVNKCEMLGGDEAARLRETLAPRLSSYDFLMLASLAEGRTYSFDRLARAQSGG